MCPWVTVWTPLSALRPPKRGAIVTANCRARKLTYHYYALITKYSVSAHAVKGIHNYLTYKISWRKATASFGSSPHGENTPPHSKWQLETTSRRPMLNVILDMVPNSWHPEFVSSADYDSLPFFLFFWTRLLPCRVFSTSPWSWIWIVPEDRSVQPPCQLGWLDKQTTRVSKLPTAKGFWEHSLHLLARWSGFMSNGYCHTHTQTHMQMQAALFKSHARPQGPWKQSRGDATPPCFHCVYQRDDLTWLRPQGYICFLPETDT